MSTTSDTQNTASITNTGLVRFRKRTTPLSLEKKIVNECITYIHTLPEVPEPEEIQEMLIPEIRQAIDNRNQNANKSDIWSKPSMLSPDFVGQLMVEFNHVVMLSMSDGVPTRNNAQLAIYCPDGDKQGCYSFDANLINAVMCRYASFSASRKRDCIDYMMANAPLIKVTRNKNLIAVRNGIFNRETKQLLPFSPDYVFTSKITVDYVDNAPNVHITMPDGEIFDCDWLIESFSPDNQAQTDFHWQIISAACRPNESWDKCVFLYSTKGCNGKGTLVSILENLCGDDTTAKINIKNMSKDFVLAGAKDKHLIIGHENPVGTFVDECDSFKAMVSGDSITINQKYAQPISMNFHGLIVQCLNELPKMHDKTDSFLRRVIFDKFNQCFTGAERKYIKSDYLKRPEVLQYYLYKALNMDFDEFTEPKECKELAKTFKSYNDTLACWWEDFTETSYSSWDIIPKKVLYEIYKVWVSDNAPNSVKLKVSDFWQQLVSLVDDADDCEWRINDYKMRVHGRMDGKLNLLIEYHLTEKFYSYSLDSTEAEGSRPETINKCIYRKSSEIENEDN